ncbi:MAG: hypothetical protein PQJ60_14620, partial [Spirochaetales bacterium]|nr:hypothetical protein [Spirochaetales bacterium]
MKGAYIRKITDLADEIAYVGYRLEEKYGEVEGKCLHSYEANNFYWSGQELDRSRRAFEEVRYDSFETYLKDQRLSKLDEILQNLLMTLQDLDQPITNTYLNDLPDSGELRGSDYSRGEHILHFKNALKNEAAEILFTNKSELKRKEYEYRNSLGVGGDESLFNNFSRILEQYRDREIKVSEGQAEVTRLRAYLNEYQTTNIIRGGEYDEAFGDDQKDRIKVIQDNIDVWEETLAQLRREKPELAVISRQFTDLGDSFAVQDELIRGFSKAHRAIDEVYGKLINDDLPFEALLPVIRTVKAKYGISEEGEEGNDSYSKHVNRWLKGQINLDRAINISVIGITVGCAIVSAIFTAGGSAAALAIGFGAAGSAVGMMGAVYNFDGADALNDVADAQIGSSGELIDDPEAAKRAYAWAVADLILSGVDVVFVGFDLMKLNRLVGMFDDAALGRKVVLQLGDLGDEAVQGAVDLFRGVDAENALRLDKVMSSGFKTYDEGLAFLRKVKEGGGNGLDVLVQLDNVDDIRTVVNYLPQERDTIRLL